MCKVKVDSVLRYPDLWPTVLLQKKFCVRVSYTVSAFPDDYVEMLLSRRHKDTYNCETPQKNWVIRWNHVVRGYTRISKPSRDGRFATKSFH